MRDFFLSIFAGFLSAERFLSGNSPALPDPRYRDANGAFGPHAKLSAKSLTCGRYLRPGITRSPLITPRFCRSRYQIKIDNSPYRPGTRLKLIFLFLLINQHSCCSTKANNNQRSDCDDIVFISCFYNIVLHFHVSYCCVSGCLLRL